MMKIFGKDRKLARSSILGALIIGLGVMTLTVGSVWGSSERTDHTAKHFDARTEQDDANTPGDPDFNDLPLGPTAWHDIQHFEWLGRLVDEEPVPVFDDNLAGKMGDDDGLVAVNWVGGNVTVTFDVMTNFTAHGPAFPVIPAGQFGGVYVDAWIDWNKNGFFDHPGEHIGTWNGDPNNGWPGNPDATTGSVTAPAVGGKGVYSVRLRLDYHDPGIVLAHVPDPGLNACGDLVNYGASFGEVEDYMSVAPVPSLTTWGLLILAVLMMLSGLYVAYRRRRGMLNV